VLDVLLDRGLMARDASPQDRRTKRLALTPKGVDYLAYMRALHEPVTNHYLAKLGPEKMDQLVELLTLVATEPEPQS
jgi:DNA-binding MarR family transcriptional regulator